MRMGATIGKSGNILDSIQTENCHIVMLGLDSAGKTTALYRLKFEQYLNTVPTIGFNCEKVQGTIGKAKGVHFLIWDVGGQEKLRPLWRSYTRCTDGILFVVDSVDIERMEEAKIELMRTAKCPDNHDAPVLILANKQDLPGACNPRDLEKLLGLYELENRDITDEPLGKSFGNNSRYDSDNDSTSKSKALQIQGSQFIKNNVGSNHLFLPEKEPIGSQYNKTFSNVADHASISHNASCGKTIDFGQNEGENFSKSDCGCKFSHYKGWYIQPACAITGEGLQEGLGVLYEMILKRRKLNKVKRKKAKR